MKILSLVFRIVAILAAVGAGFLAWKTQGIVKEAEDNLSNEQQAHELTQAELKETKDSLAISQSDLEGARTEAERERAEKNTLNRQLAGARKETSTERTEKEEALAQVSDLKGQVSQLKKELIEERTKVPEVDPKEFEAAQEQVADLQKKVKDLEAELEEAKTAAATPKEPTLGGSSTAVAANGEGKPGAAPAKSSAGIETTLIAYRPELGMMVLGLGSAKGLKEDMTVSVMSGGRLGARVLISKVTSNQAVGNVIPGEGAPIILNEKAKVKVSL